MATVLANEGFNTVEEVAYTERDDLVTIEEFSEEMIDELQRRAQDIMLTREIAEQAALVPEDDLLNMEGMTDEWARTLASKGVRSMEDLAECATDELMGLIVIEEQNAQELIMTARAPWFE